MRVKLKYGQTRKNIFKLSKWKKLLCCALLLRKGAGKCSAKIYNGVRSKVNKSSKVKF